MPASTVYAKLRLVQCSKLKQATQSSHEVEPDTEQHQQRHAAVVLFFTSVPFYMRLLANASACHLHARTASASNCQAPDCPSNFAAQTQAFSLYTAATARRHFWQQELRRTLAAPRKTCARLRIALSKQSPHTLGAISQQRLLSTSVATGARTRACLDVKDHGPCARRLVGRLYPLPRSGGRYRHQGCAAAVRIVLTHAALEHCCCQNRPNVCRTKTLLELLPGVCLGDPGRTVLRRLPSPPVRLPVLHAIGAQP